MKKTLLTLSFLGLCASQVSASVVGSFATENSNRIYSTATDNANGGEVYVSSDDEISLAIQNLSAQAQQKEDHLAALAERLTEEAAAKQAEEDKIAAELAAKAEREAVAARAASLRATSSSNNTLTSSSPPAIAAARASQAAHANTIGLCAKYVRRALQAAGYRFTPNPSAYQYATRGTLANAGFVKVSNNTPPQVGDVVVYNRTARHIHGHIQIFDGKNWVSDFRQARKSPYSGNHSYTTWRDARYLNNASNQGIYLAMDD